MREFAGIIIIFIVLLVAVYVLRTVLKAFVLTKKRKKNQHFLLCQVNDFVVEPIIQFNQEEDLLSPCRMTNNGIDVIGEEIQMEDYVENVPWYIYL